MSRLLETIQIKNGKALNLKAHQNRIEFSYKTLNWGAPRFDLLNFFMKLNLPKDGVWKCRFLYGLEIIKVQFLQYRKKFNSSLKVVDGKDISYDLKYEDRSELKSLYKKRKTHDDVIILKDGLVTDSYYANILFQKHGLWFTPKSPLLKGIQRSLLIAESRIMPIDIYKADIKKYDSIKLINAMNSFEEAQEIKIEQVYF